MTRMTVISAHGMDWVWRSGGAILKHIQGGGEATVVALSMGEHGESGPAWATEGQTAEHVRGMRRNPGGRRPPLR